MKKIRGFSLIELLTVLAIISIIGAFCVPLYSQYIAHERRLAAATMLNKLALALEQHYISTNTYQGVSFKSLNFPDKTHGGHYQLAIQSATAYEYVLQAMPLGLQKQEDNLCGNLILDSKGRKNITGGGKVTECW